jgi:hypothetical protein
LRAEIVDGVSLLVSGAAKEGGTMDDRVNTADRGLERIAVSEVAFSEIDTLEVICTGSLAHESADLIAALSQPLGQAAPDFSGRTGDEYFHAHNIASAARRELEESDIQAGACAITGPESKITPWMAAQFTSIASHPA